MPIKLKLVVIFFLTGFLFLPFILSAETISVAHQKDYFPYSWIEEGEPKGLLIDWWKLWATKADVELEFIGGSTDECVAMVVAGKADAVAGLFLIEGPRNELEYSEYILRMNTTLLLKKKYRPESVLDIDISMAVLRNELSHQIVLAKYPELKFRYFDTSDSLFYAIENEEVDGFVYEYPNLLGNYKGIEPPSGYYKFEIIKEDRIRPAVRAGNAELLNLLITGSAKITDAELATIIEEYDAFEKPISIEWIVFILGAVILVLALIVIRLSRRQREGGLQSGDLDITDLRKLIRAGENDKVEFKSSLRWDYRQEKPNKALEHVILKTIAAFLNSMGGKLFIGVDDDGNLLGLDKDYQSLNKRNSDGFILALTNQINQNLGKNIHRSVTINIVTIENKEVCLVEATKSENPVFVGKKGEEEFFIRTAASSQPMSMKEAMDYIQAHWPEKKS